MQTLTASYDDIVLRGGVGQNLNYKLEIRWLFLVRRWSYFQVGSKEKLLRCCQNL
jgi:hypothetical protein